MHLCDLRPLNNIGSLQFTSKSASHKETLTAHQTHLLSNRINSLASIPTDQRAITDTRSLIHQIDDPVEALCHLERLLTGYALEVMHPSLWRELLPLILFGGSNGLPEGYRAMNDALMAEISELLRVLQRAGKLRPQLE